MIEVDPGSVAGEDVSSFMRKVVICHDFHLPLGKEYM